MSFSLDKLQKLNLKAGEWVTIKYPTVEGFHSGQIAGGGVDAPIFDIVNERIFVQFHPQSFVSELEIGKIENLFRHDTHPTYSFIYGTFYPIVRKWGNLIPQHLYSILKANGEVNNIVFEAIRIENDDKGIPQWYLIHKDNGEIKRMSFYEIVDVI